MAAGKWDALGLLGIFRLVQMGANRRRLSDRLVAELGRRLLRPAGVGADDLESEWWKDTTTRGACGEG
ncbi:MAG TPA: hypothetical protein VNY81_10715 [Candidatus Saccharimonadales bacterium]|nr:hypothetical protein [Candidatus Saccharimonadales bacterium]